MDVTTKIRGQAVTIRDVEDPGYVAPTTGYVIHLTSAQARAFIRDGELVKLREERDSAAALRALAVERIQQFVVGRDEQIAERDAQIAKLDALNANIQELVAWLQATGDAT